IVKFCCLSRKHHVYEFEVAAFKQILKVYYASTGMAYGKAILLGGGETGCCWYQGSEEDPDN
ncbi:hypothetical protein A2U01_0016909, partial [Trifolium medium]|nr:hypothetical protein [Trifolium medium]